MTMHLDDGIESDDLAFHLMAAAQWKRCNEFNDVAATGDRKTHAGP